MSTSRLCVKNVPKHATEKQLKEHFARKGEITDVKILKTRHVHTPPQWHAKAQPACLCLVVHPMAASTA